VKITAGFVKEFPEEMRKFLSKQIDKSQDIFGFLEEFPNSSSDSLMNFLDGLHVEL
jgi:hypothetical protein